MAQSHLVLFFGMALPVLVAPGCGGNGNGNTGGGGGASSSSSSSSAESSSSSSAGGAAASSSSTSASSSSSSGSGGGGGSAEAKPIIVPISATGHDRFYNVTYDAQGNLVAVGQVADSIDAAADFATVVARFKPDGTLDKTFATNGIFTQNIAVGTTGELFRGLAIQSTGKIVVAGTIEHTGAADPRDRDIALLRLNPDGTRDDSFGVMGVVTLDLSDGEVVGNGYVADAQWALLALADDHLIVTGAQKAPGRTDSDFATVRLNADGSIDKTYGTDGVTLLDINMQNASARAGTILADGSIIACGYMSVNGVNTPVVYKLSPSGQLDNTFGMNGVFNQAVLAAQTETYAAIPQGKNLVTVGYGRNDAAESLDWLSLRLTDKGQLDNTYGNSGVVRVDIGTFNDNARSIQVLPDNRVVLVGGGRPASDNVDGAIGFLTPDGKPDTTFSQTGWKLWDLGGPNDFFWGSALSADKKTLAVAGIKGVGMNPGNDDAVIMLVPIP